MTHTVPPFECPVFATKEIPLLKNTHLVSKTMLRFALKLWLPKRLRNK